MVVSVTQNIEPRHRPLMQAQVKALDPHGVRVVSVGTVLFALASVACWVGQDALAARGKGWWLASALVGLGIGVVTLLALLARRARLRRAAPLPPRADQRSLRGFHSTSVGPT